MCQIRVLRLYSHRTGRGTRDPCYVAHTCVRSVSNRECQRDRDGGPRMTSVDAAAQLAGSRLREGRPHEAAAAYGAALRLMPGSAALWSDRGISLNQAGRRSEAFAAYEAALRLDPTHTNAYNNLAVARHAEGDAGCPTAASASAATTASALVELVRLHACR